MPTFSAAQTRPVPTQAAGLSARVSFAVARQLPAPAQVARLEVEQVPDAHLSAVQVEAAPVHRLRLLLSKLPAEPRPPGVPATPRLV